MIFHDIVAKISKYHQAMNRLFNLKTYTIVNLAGQVLPLAVGLVTIPRLLHMLGVERFGALSVIWVLIGYFSLFDFGLSRTLTYLSAQFFRDKKWKELSETFWSVFFLSVLISAIGSLLLGIIYFFDYYNYIKASEVLIGEIKASLLGIALSIPVVSAMTALRGFLEGDERFFTANLLQSLMGIYTFVSPLFLPPGAAQLQNLVWLLLVGRLVFTVAHFFVIAKSYPFLFPLRVLRTKSQFLELLRYGGWLTVSNLVNPIMVYLDRFFLALLVPTSQLAFYTTPYEMVSRLMILPGSITRAIFPRLSQVQGEEEVRALTQKSLKYTFFAMTAVCLGLALLSSLVLKIWLGGEFPEKSTSIMLILCLGVYSVSFAFTPYTLLQSKGRSDLTAKIHLFELPIYLMLFYFLTRQWGIVGAAWAWTLRALLDTFLMFSVARRLKNP